MLPVPGKLNTLTVDTDGTTIDTVLSVKMSECSNPDMDCDDGSLDQCDFGWSGATLSITMNEDLTPGATVHLEIPTNCFFDDADTPNELVRFPPRA